MKSGLEDRNNNIGDSQCHGLLNVSMKSGLEDRNNYRDTARDYGTAEGLNEVRPGRPEQSLEADADREWSRRSQ